jgi:hypothetical protein
MWHQVPRAGAIRHGSLANVPSIAVDTKAQRYPENSPDCVGDGTQYDAFFNRPFARFSLSALPDWAISKPVQGLGTMDQEQRGGQDRDSSFKNSGF